MAVLRNATAVADSLGLRFSVDTRTYWPNFPVPACGPPACDQQAWRPAHEILMETVGEVVLNPQCHFTSLIPTSRASVHSYVKP
jgi:hypothetical protein